MCFCFIRVGLHKNFQNRNEIHWPTGFLNMFSIFCTLIFSKQLNQTHVLTLSNSDENRAGCNDNVWLLGSVSQNYGTRQWGSLATLIIEMKWAVIIGSCCNKYTYTVSRTIWIQKGFRVLCGWSRLWPHVLRAPFNSFNNIITTHRSSFHFYKLWTLITANK